MFTWTSCLSEYMDPFCQHLNQLLSERLPHMASFYDPHWAVRQQAIAQGDIQGGFICGLLYVWGVSQGWKYEPIVAPVMADGGTSTDALYYADVLVQKDSQFKTFSDLEGASFAVNEYQSFSGYHMLSTWMAPEHSPTDYFAEIQLSGSHWQSLQLVASGQADCATIDSTLMAMLAQREPEKCEPYRAVERIGPFPAPPFVVNATLSSRLKQAVQERLLALSTEEQGKALLADWGITGFVPVNAATYQPIMALPIQL